MSVVDVVAAEVAPHIDVVHRVVRGHSVRGVVVVKERHVIGKLGLLDMGSDRKVPPRFEKEV
jgi:hypothetical protein